MSKSRRLDPGRGLVTLPGRRFMMGTRDADANPADHETHRQETVAPFRIAVTPVTNQKFAAFAKATGHVTTAEREGWSAVFYALVAQERRAQARINPVTPWWVAVEGASWRRPGGEADDVCHRLSNHPVVHVSRDDAEAYCAWAGLRLPTEVEWEYAARGGLEDARYPWGQELRPGGRPMCTIFSGEFPEPEGHVGTTAVKTYAPNGFGLHDVAGNVWEWTSSAWQLPSPPEACCAPTRPAAEAAESPQAVIRGGSYLCHDSYCNRYRVSARTHNTADSSSGNQGFRVAADAG